MAVGKRIIILRYENAQVRYALRGDTPSGQGDARPEYLSCYGDVADPDLAAIKAGTVTEVIESNSYTPSSGETGTQFRNRVQGILEGRWSDWNTLLQAATPKNFFGRFWNGTVWAAFP